MISIKKLLTVPISHEALNAMSRRYNYRRDIVPLNTFYATDPKQHPLMFSTEENKYTVFYDKNGKINRNLFRIEEMLQYFAEYLDFEGLDEAKATKALTSCFRDPINYDQGFREFDTEQRRESGDSKYRLKIGTGFTPMTKEQYNFVPGDVEEIMMMTSDQCIAEIVKFYMSGVEC